MNFERFKEIISEEFNISSTEVVGEIEFRNMEAWSSLHALLFIARINEETEVMLSSADLATCKYLNDIYELIGRK
jgi:acyl carrier protein